MRLTSTLISMALLAAVEPVLAAPEPAASATALPAVALTSKLSGAQKALRTKLLATREAGRFVCAADALATAAPVLVALAAEARPAAEVSAALDAAAQAHVPADKNGQPSSPGLAVWTPDYRTVVLARLSAQDAEVRAAAYSALAPLLSGYKGDAATLAALAKVLASSADPAQRLRAVQALGQVSLYGVRDTAELPPVALAACADKEPMVRATALIHLMTFAKSRTFVETAGRDKLLAVLQGARRDADPATRGLSAAVAASLAIHDEDDQRHALQISLLPLLKDPEPLVRALGAVALGLRPPKAVLAEIGLLLGDGAKAQWTVQGPAVPDGKAASMPLRALPDEPNTVAQAAALALMQASDPVGKDGFYCESAEEAKAAAAAQACIEKARAWLAKQTTGGGPATRP